MAEIEDLIKKSDLLERNLFAESRTEEKEIIEFLENACEYAVFTCDSDGFVNALRLIQKWKVILISYYDRVYKESVSRSSSAFSLQARYNLGDRETKQVSYLADQDFSSVPGWGWSDKLDSSEAVLEQLGKGEDDSDLFVKDNPSISHKNQFYILGQ